MSKHTNGPWKVRTSPRGSKALTIFQAKADDLPIATVHIGAGTTASQAANANLIASAPELLEALELAAIYIEDGATNTALERIKAAVKKAKGE